MNKIVFFGSSGIELHQCKRPFKNKEFCEFNKNSKYYLYDYPLYFTKYSEKSHFPAFIIYKKVHMLLSICTIYIIYLYNLYISLALSFI